ncbi:MAG: preprotein translocase subunit SecE [Deltaproteobacteria bacterium]|nr:preprotein translocase subunit SecE [Deltaproteobacteria bacterium]
MGRIQRKKPVKGSKRKKQKGENGSASSTKNGLPPKKSVSTAAAKQTSKTVSSYPGKKQIDAAIQFLREVRVELRKVTWPSRKQTIGSTMVVIVLVLIISAFLGVMDLGLSSLVKVVLQ